jgi:hypothetical protein
MNFYKKNIKYYKRFMISHPAFHHAKRIITVSLEIYSESPPKKGTML